MTETTTGPEFLKQKYNLHTTPEVESAAQRTEGRTGEALGQEPLLRIQNYLDRFTEIINRPDSAKRERGIDSLKRILHDKYVIKPDEIPEAYWENQKRILRERGQEADLDYVDWQTVREQNTEAIIADQRSSLDNWIDYLASSDAMYPDWLKYYAIRNVLGMGTYDKQKKAFSKRTQGTTKPFPELNREAFAYVLDAIEKKNKGEAVSLDTLVSKDKVKFEKLIQGENFSKLYAWAIEKITPASVEALTNTKGQWVKYDRGSDHIPLADSIQGHGTGWCTAGESTAKTQLEGGDFYVYYSLDQENKPTIPRAAIRMEENRIAEVRGIAEEQNLDPFITDVVEEKLEEFPDGKAYQKKAADMKLLTAIDQKVQAELQLSQDELAFLYEIHSTIEGFGYQRDPRITELRAKRSVKEDMPIAFGCTFDQIAHSPDEIREDTVAYVGALAPGLFDKSHDHIKYIYTTFPEGKITRESIEIGGKSTEEIISQLEQNDVQIQAYARDLLNGPDFITSSNTQMVHLIRLCVRDLGLDYPTTEDIYKRAEELGLKLCPVEVAPYYRLHYKEQPLDERLYIGMSDIVGRGSYKDTFRLENYRNRLFLHSGDKVPGDRWPDPKTPIVFKLPK